MADELAQVHDLDVAPAGAIDETNAHLDEETGTWSFDSEAAVKLVIADASTADSYLNLNQWASGWTMADLLYQSPSSASAFDGGGPSGQANVPKFILSNHI